MTLQKLCSLSENQIKFLYHLSDNQYQTLIDTTNHILDQMMCLRIAEEKGYATHGYRMKIKDGIDYADLYKAVKSKHYSLWTGLISREAYREYYLAYLENRKPKVTAEHFWNRARVIHEIFTGDWGNILEEYNVKGFIWLYFEFPGMGEFHITTETENAALSNTQQRNFDLSWREQYDNLDVELFSALKDNNWNQTSNKRKPLTGMFDTKPPDFWKYPNYDELLADLEMYDINVKDIEHDLNLKTLV